MSKLKHTPGPWKIGYNDNSGHGIITKYNNFIACVSYGDYVNSFYKMLEEEEANARLICAAPEMLDRDIKFLKSIDELELKIKNNEVQYFSLDVLRAVRKYFDTSPDEKATGQKIEEVLGDE